MRIIRGRAIQLYKSIWLVDFIEDKKPVEFLVEFQLAS